MSYRADLAHDTPSVTKKKRIIFYRGGLKIYGLLPYILQKKLKAQFFSNTPVGGGVMMLLPSHEDNWTAVPYDQSPERLQSLLDWLYSDAGFEVALASRESWEDDIFSANIMNHPPSVWFPLGQDTHKGFLQIQAGMTRFDIAGLLALPRRKEEDAKEKESH